MWRREDRIGEAGRWRLCSTTESPGWPMPTPRRCKRHNRPFASSPSATCRRREVRRRFGETSSRVVSEILILRGLTIILVQVFGSFRWPLV